MAFSFGASSSATPQQPAAAPAFSFGSTPASTSAPALSFGAPAPATNLFGSTPAAQPSLGSFGALGKPAATPAAPSQPKSTLINPFAPAPKTLGASVSTNKANLPLEKWHFEDLGEAEKKTLVDMETFIKARTAIADELYQRGFGEEIKQSYDGLQDVETSIVALQVSMAHLRRVAFDQKGKTNIDVQDRIKAQRILDTYSSSKIGGATSGSSSEARSVAWFPHQYFTRTLASLADQVQTCGDALHQIQSQLSAPMRHQTAAILPSLKAQHRLCLSLAAKLQTLHSDMREMKAVYSSMWQQKVGSKRDVFEVLRVTPEQQLEIDALAL